MRRRSKAFALGAGMVLALAALACGEDPVPKLEAERDALVASTQPKAAFWSEVERKGGYAKERREIEKERADVTAQVAALAPEQEQLAAALAQAQAATAQAQAGLAQNRAELARVEGEVAKREETLARFTALATAPEAAP